MNKLYLIIVALLYTTIAFGQNSLKIKIVNAGNKEPLPSATVSIPSLNKTVTADSNGIAVFQNIPLGNYKVMVTYAGYAETEITMSVPFGGDYLRVSMNPDDDEEEIIIQSTRSTRTISDIPTRIEFVAGEELDEKANMKPGDIRMVLNESTGITTQQTSATSANASIRIQGLDGRYTQILKDGFPLYAGFSSGLGLLQTPPLDLKQFEVIKGICFHFIWRRRYCRVGEFNF
jgi:iron complex outermembrane receptor protein